MRFSCPPLQLAIMIAISCSIAPAHAGTDDRDQQARIRTAVQSGKIIPLPRILTLAQRRVPGEILEVELEEEHDRFEYEVKIMTAEGRIMEITLDARTGAVLEVERD